MNNKIKSLLLLLLGFSLPASLIADQITTGSAHNLVARGNSFIYSWGANEDGQLGDGSTLDSLNPLNVVDQRYRAVSGVIAVDAHGTNNIVLLDDHTMLGWGSNENSQLGSGLLNSGKFRGDTDEEEADPEDPDSVPEPESTALKFPVAVVDPDGKPISNVIKVVTGSNFSAAISQEDTVLVWGNLESFEDQEQEREPVNKFSDKFFDPDAEFIDSRYFNGDPTAEYELKIMRDAAGEPILGIVDIAVGDSHLLALTQSGHVLAWGENESGQLADGTLRQRAYPVHVLNQQRQVLGGITSVEANGQSSIAVRADGHVFGWGTFGILQPEPFETNSDVLSRPVEPFARILTDSSGNKIRNIKQIALGASHVLAVTFSNTVVGWGDNSSGQLGNGTNSAVDGADTIVDDTNSTTNGASTVVDGDGVPLTDVLEVAVGDSHSLAVRSNGQVFAWGSAENGRLGDGTNIDSYYAVKVRGRDNAPFSLY